MLYLCAKGSAFGWPLKKWTKIQFSRIYFFFGEEKENAKKEGTHRDGLLGEEIFMVQFPRDFPQLLTSIFQSSFFWRFC